MMVSGNGYVRTTRITERKATSMIGTGQKEGGKLDSDDMTARILDDVLLSAISSAGRFVPHHSKAPYTNYGDERRKASYWYQGYRAKYDALGWVFIDNLDGVVLDFARICDARGLCVKAVREAVIKNIVESIKERGELDEIEFRLLRSTKADGAIRLLQEAISKAIDDSKRPNQRRIRDYQEDTSRPVGIKTTQEGQRK